MKTWTLDFGRALRDRGHGVVAVVREGTPFVDACHGELFRTYPLRFGPKYNPVAILRVVRILRAERPEVAVVNISRDLNVGAVACRLAGVPVVHRVGSRFDYKRSWEERFWHRTLVDRVLVPCHTLKRSLVTEIPWIRPEKVTVIHNSKDLQVYSPAPRHGGGEVVFGITGQLSDDRGHANLFNALGELRKRGVPARLRVAGTGPEESELRRMVTALGLDPVVEFCGFQRDVPGFLRTLDVFVLPSHDEAFPNTVLEALCSGLPVVATDLEGIREMVGETSMLVPVADEQALADAMASLAVSPEQRSRLGETARAWAEARFDIRVNAGKLEALLREVASR